MKVYVVLNGERFENGSVRAICRTKEKAIQVALSTTRYFDGEWKEAGANYWVNGGDFVSVEKFELKK